MVDLGSGTGFGASMLDFVAESVIGVEIDEAGLAAARTRYPHVRFEHTDLCCDPLPEGDVATMFEVLEHLPDPEGALDAISSTYPRLLISFPNPLFAGSHLNPHHLVDWPLSALKRELRRRGGRILEQRQSSMRGMNLRRGAHAWSATWVLDVSFG